MTWLANDGWVYNLRSRTYTLKRPAGTGYVWKAKTGWWLGRVVLADGTTRWLSSQRDRRHVEAAAEQLLDEQPSEVSA